MRSNNCTRRSSSPTCRHARNAITHSTTSGATLRTGPRATPRAATCATILALAITLSMLSGCSAPAPAASMLEQGASFTLPASTTWNHLDFAPAAGDDRAAVVHVPPGVHLVLDHANLRHVRFIVDGTLEIRNSTIHLSAGALQIHGSLALFDTTLQDSPGELIRATRGTIFAENIQFQNAQGNAVRLFDSHIHIQQGTWDNITGYGIHAERSTLQLRSIQSRSTLDYGLRLESSTLALQEGTFLQECGIYLRDSDATIQATMFQASGHGITAFASNLTLQNSTFQGGNLALFLNEGNATLDRLHITDVQTALRARGPVQLTHSSISGHGTLLNLTTHPGILLQDNNIVGSGILLDNTGETTLHVPNNWWGHDPPETNRIRGPVTLSPWATAPYPDPPASE